MRLQVNARGGWSNVCEFEPHQLRAFQEAVVTLAQALSIGGRQDMGSSFQPSWRVTATISRSPKVVCWLHPARAFASPRKWRQA